MSVTICQGGKGERKSDMNEEKTDARAESLHPDCRGDNHPGLIDRGE